MKKLILSGFLFIGSVLNAQEVEKSLDNYTELSVSGVANVSYYPSTDSKIIINGANGDIEHVEYSVENGKLNLSTKGHNGSSLQIKLYGQNLTRLTASDATNFKSVDTIRTENFDINASGASKVNLAIIAKRVNLTSSDAANVTLRGKTNVFKAYTTGASNTKAYELASDSCDIESSGASNIRLTSNEKLNILSTGSSHVKFKGNPKEISAEGNETSKIVKINESGDKDNGDSTKTTTFRYKGKKIIIIDNDHSRRDSLKHNWNHDLTRKHWQGLWFGFAGYVNPQHEFSMYSPYSYMDLDYGKSYTFQWNLGQKNINIIKKYVQLSTGIGLQFSNYSFTNKTKLNADSSFTWGRIDSTNSFSYHKNRFKQAYVTVPLLLNFNTSNRLKRNFHLSAGVVGKYLLTSRTKQILEHNSDKYTIVRKDSYNLNPFQVDAYASVGYRNVTVYAQFGITELFQNKKAPEVYGFSAGIRLLNFD